MLRCCWSKIQKLWVYLPGVGSLSFSIILPVLVNFLLCVYVVSALVLGSILFTIVRCVHLQLRRYYYPVFSACCCGIGSFSCWYIIVAGVVFFVGAGVMRKCCWCMPIAGWITTIKQCQHWWPLTSLSHHIHQTCPCENSLVSMVIKYEPFRLWVLGKLSLRVKRLQREAGHLHQPSAEIRNKWNYTSTLPYAFVVFTGTTLPLSLTRQTHCRDKTTKTTKK